MKFIAALINHSLQPARTNNWDFISASDTTFSPNSPYASQQSQSTSVTDSTLNKPIYTDNDNSGSRQFDDVEVEISSDFSQSNINQTGTLSDTRQFDVIESETSSDLLHQVLNTDFSSKMTEAKDSEDVRSVLSEEDNSEVVSFSDGEYQLDVLTKLANGIDDSPQIDNQAYLGSKEYADSYDIHDSKKNVLDNHSQINSVFEGIEKSVNDNSVSKQKIDTTDVKSNSQQKSVNDASQIAQSKHVDTNETQNDVSKDVNRQTLNSEVIHAAAKQADPINSHKVSSNQFLSQPRVLPSGIKSVKKPERRESPQVKIGHINVLIDDQAAGKPSRSVTKSASSPSNPFGLRGL